MHDQNKNLIFAFVLVSSFAESVHFLQKLCNLLLQYVVLSLEHQLEKLVNNVFDFQLLLTLGVVWENLLEILQSVANQSRHRLDRSGGIRAGGGSI